MSAAAAAPGAARVTVMTFIVGNVPGYYDPEVTCSDLYVVLKRLGFRRMSLHYIDHQARSMMLEHDLGVTREAIVRELEKGAGVTSFVLPKVPVQPGREELKVKWEQGPEYGQEAVAKVGSIYLSG